MVEHGPNHQSQQIAFLKEFLWKLLLFWDIWWVDTSSGPIDAVWAGVEVGKNIIFLEYSGLEYMWFGIFWFWNISGLEYFGLEYYGLKYIWLGIFWFGIYLVWNILIWNISGLEHSGLEYIWFGIFSFGIFLVWISHQISKFQMIITTLMILNKWTEKKLSLAWIFRKQFHLISKPSQYSPSSTVTFAYQAHRIIL